MPGQALGRGIENDEVVTGSSGQLPAAGIGGTGGLSAEGVHGGHLTGLFEVSGPGDPRAGRGRVRAGERRVWAGFSDADHFVVGAEGGALDRQGAGAVGDAVGLNWFV